jgi:signal transduction histidine kinase
MASDRTWLHRWIYTLAAGFMFSASTLRAVVTFQYSDLLCQVLLLLALWLLLFVGNALFRHRLSWSTAIFLLAQAAVILYLLLITEEDFFAFLFGLVGMQAMQCYSPRVMAGLVLLFAVLVFLILQERTGWLQALALTLIYSTLGAFMAAYIWSIRRAGMIQEQQDALLSQLQQANQQLEFHAHQQEQLITGRERQRLARELHDSVTQTIFSMTLTTQSTLLLLERDQGRVFNQLDRLDQLAQSALAEIHTLISHLAPKPVTRGDFVYALQQHLEDRRRLDNLVVTLEVQGYQLFKPAEEVNLFRIAQEALNNIVKHAGVQESVIRLHCAELPWMEIEDHGIGFDPQRIHAEGRMGLTGMHERAAEIGWTLRVQSSPGYGTCIRVEKVREE